MKTLIATLGTALLALLLSGCGGDQATAADQKKIETELADLSSQIVDLKSKLADAAGDKQAELEKEMEAAQEKRKGLNEDLEKIKQQLADLVEEAGEKGKDAVDDLLKGDK